MTEEIKRRKKDSAKLVWDSKPKRAPNPKDIDFQTAEVVIPNPKRDIDQLPFSFKDGKIDEVEIDKYNMNRLIWGDNLLAMQALLSQGYEGKINLIYIDPPFDSKADYSHKIYIDKDEVMKEPSVIERLAYKDTWAGGIDSYLDMLYPRLQLMKRLLSDNGSIYVHCDYRLNSYIRLILDEIFGNDNFLNEIIWCYSEREISQTEFNKKHDNILFYSKIANNSERTFNCWEITLQYSESSIKKYNLTDENSRKYQIRGKGGSFVGKQQLPPDIEKKHPDWVYRDYLDLKKGVLPRDWFDDIDFENRASKDRTGYPTQKPTKLLERLIKVSSKEGDLVADLFCGSGTTLSVAEKLNRRWIGCELGKIGIQVSRARLVNQGSKPFLLENIGNYQREMIYLSGGNIGEMQRIILKLYGATPRKGSAELGIKTYAKDEKTELVYVGYPDRPVSAKKAEELARMAESMDGIGYSNLIILAWDYAYNYHTELENRKKASKKPWKTEITSLLIPPDVYEYLKKAKDEEEIEAFADKVQFYGQPYLKLAKPEIKKLEDKWDVNIAIEKFTIFFDFPVNQDDREKLMEISKKDPFLLIDYWAVDWNYDGYTFKSQWQDFRGYGKKAEKVSNVANNIYEKPGEYTIAVRVVDIFGNDASATIKTKL